MKKIYTLITVLLTIVLFSACGNKQVNLNPGKPANIAILTKDGNLPNLTTDQQRELDRVIQWMDKDIIKDLRQAGFNAVLIKDRSKYSKNMGMLLIADVDAFNAGNRAARAFVGFGAGAASLDMDYTLLNKTGDRLLSWKDGVGSSKGGTYCAQTLNGNTINKLVEYLNGN